LRQTDGVGVQMGKSDARANFVLLRNDERRLYRGKNRELRMLPMRMRHAPELKRWHSIRVEIILRVFWWFREYIFFLVFEAKINSLLLIENNKTQVLLLFFLMFRSH
jgi:hypothetical protein